MIYTRLNGEVHSCEYVKKYADAKKVVFVAVDLDFSFFELIQFSDCKT